MGVAIGEVGECLCDCCEFADFCVCFFSGCFVVFLLLMYTCPKEKWDGECCCGQTKTIAGRPTGTNLPSFQHVTLLETRCSARVAFTA